MKLDVIGLNTKWRVLAVAVGAVGAAGEAYLLWHTLVNWLAYKISNEAALFQIIAYKSLFAAPLIGVAVSWLFTRASLKWGPAVSTVVCPAVFVLFYVVAFSWVGIDWTTLTGLDGMTHGDLLASFAWLAARLAAAGFAISFLCGWLLDGPALISINKVSQQE
ncbi:MAG: hypothetical protein IPM63_14895 [Acidobacteriota bacterium]|nr:MAG: hypothetical protein IPM63_14895 [Acidobacteriota bacterium]